MRKSLLSASLLVGLCILSVSAAPALAAPEWGITIEHHNAYGAQRASCPGGHESLGGEPDCGVNPYNGSGSAFDVESGYNEYEITVDNLGDESGGAGSASVGQSVNCAPGAWGGSPTSIEYQWLRGGEPIAGATGASYTIQVEDSGRSVQCRVTAANSGGAVAAVASGQAANPAAPILVTPVSGSALPTPPSSGIARVSGVANEKEKVLTCNAGAWGNGPTTYAYVWLRNGRVIAETPNSAATSNTYTLTSRDLETAAAFQCQVVAANAAGAVASVSSPSRNTTAPAPVPSVTPPTPGTNTQRPMTGPLLSVVDTLPEGLSLAGPSEEEEASGLGWSCDVLTASTVTCVQREATVLAPGASYEPITLHVHVDRNAELGTPPTGGVTNVATVSGGGASPASAVVSNPTTIAPAVPFGIQSFTTAVTGELGEPFTQAGGHPFAASATFVFNYVSDDAGFLKTASGSPRDLETELPAGFVGDPQASAVCPAATFYAKTIFHAEEPCPLGTAVGFIAFSYNAGRIVDGRPEPLRPSNTVPIYDVAPGPGHPASFGFIGGASYAPFTLDPKLRSDGDYGLTLASPHTAIPTLLEAKATFCDDGVVEDPQFACGPVVASVPPFLTNPSRCSGSAPVTTLRADAYEEAEYASMSSYAGAPSASPSFVGQPGTSAAPTASSFVTRCNLLQFAPEVEYGPSSSGEGGTTQAGQPTGATFKLKVPQSNDSATLATPDVQAATVMLPEGVTVDPSAAGGLEACSDAEFGLGAKTEPAEPADCPSASQLGTVVVRTPLLEKPIEGEAFVGEPECSPCGADDAHQGRVFRLFLQVKSVERGVIVKLAGKVSANPTTGRLQATFSEQPQLPFSDLELTLKGGPRAPLANPQTCGSATTTTDLTPWSAPGLGGLSGSEPIAGTPDAHPFSSFNVDWDGRGGACPSSLPFNPSFLAQTASSSAGQYSPLSVSFGRPAPAHESEERDEQSFAGVTVNMPPGLLGKIAGVAQCSEAEANAGTCSSTSEIGTATVGAGAGSHPYYLTGHVYLTGPYKGDPFGLSVVVPAEAGPFKLAGNTGTGLEVVRAAIAVNPSTAALTVTSDPLPQIVDGVPLRLHNVRVDVTRTGFTLNPTNCAAQQITATIAGEAVKSGEAGKTVAGSSQFAASGCASLPFGPSFSASTQAQTSKADGASLRVVVAQKAGESNIAKVDVQLPKQLPSRLTTLQKACLAATFESNPAACPALSVVGAAVAHTPLLNTALTGPAYLVSHGGEAFPSIELVLQGENGLEIILEGKTDIKSGITFSRFETVPDAPISSFELSLPQGSDSVFATDLPASASSSLCGQNLVMPTTITGQNGKQVIQTTKITTGACTKVKAKVLTRAQKLAKALKACRTKYKAKGKKAKRMKCEKQARKKYGPLHKAKKKAKKSSNRNGKAGR